MAHDVKRGRSIPDLCCIFLDSLSIPDFVSQLLEKCCETNCRQKELPILVAHDMHVTMCAMLYINPLIVSVKGHYSGTSDFLLEVFFWISVLYSEFVVNT